MNLMIQLPTANTIFDSHTRFLAYGGKKDCINFSTYPVLDGSCPKSETEIIKTFTRKVTSALTILTIYNSSLILIDIQITCCKTFFQNAFFKYKACRSVLQ